MPSTLLLAQNATTTDVDDLPYPRNAKDVSILMYRVASFLFPLINGTGASLIALPLQIPKSILFLADLPMRIINFIYEQIKGFFVSLLSGDSDGATGGSKR
ncbi:unnamed protein product [Phyllotreta striolata]|uniref:Uncharacterized protein n=1 Tax=Phyllotreta striolata TaxID=444603 RepID=A0A9N9TJN6_PHYSR|nr:unnamed protein product [Phyllotreta striolata]